MSRDSARRLVTTCLFASFALAALANDGEPGSIDFERYRAAVETSRQAYANGEFDAAFRLCSEAARWGEKDCQYMLAMMYLSGKGTEASIVEGYAWYTVAMESENPKWMPVYKKLGERLPAPVLDAARQLARDYVSHYGSEATGVYCTRTQKNGAMLGVRETICSCPDTIDRSGYANDPCPSRTRANVWKPRWLND